MKFRALIISALAATLATSTACAQRHHGTRGDYGYAYPTRDYGYAYGGYVREAPPPPRHERWGRPPAVGYVWCDGYWDWRNGRWFWVDGTWRRPPQARAAWAPGHWRQYPKRGYRWSPGRWRH